MRFTYPRGSIATLTYVAGGDPAVGKEYLEIFGGGLSIRMDDYKKLTVSKRGRRKTRRAILRQDKGHRQELSLFIERLRQGGSAPISFEEIVNSTLTTFAVQEALSSGEEIRLSAIKSRLAERVSSSSEISSADIDRRLPGDAP